MQVMHFLQGRVELAVESAFPERVINLCAEGGILLSGLHWQSPTAFTCAVTRRDYRRLRRATEPLDCTVTVVRTAGAPFLLGRARRRQVLLCGVCLGALLLLAGSFFVWDYAIVGNTTVTDEEILRALSRNGVGFGTFGFSIDPEELRNHVLLELPALSWIGVNVSGCRAYVQVRERVPRPELISKDKPSNVVATRDGLVIRVQALSGEAQVLPGTTVEQGELLIAGIWDLDTTGARVSAGRGQVFARTWRRYTVQMPLTAVKKTYTGQEKHRYAMDFGTKRIKFYGKSSIDRVGYDKIEHPRKTGYDKTARRTKWVAPGGLALPVTWVTETYRPYLRTEVPVSPTKAQAAGEAILTDYLATQLGEGDSLSSTLVTAREKDGVLWVTLTAECVEQIGQMVELPSA
ncbi:MAG: sporulation protein YqfD [Oscillospiraceae bacterium]